jgi:polyisoprenyl-teichoic acid--peptidoglycan teichoic acid transferase
MLTGLGTLVPGAGLVPTRLRGLGLFLTTVFLLSILVAAWQGLTRGLLNTALTIGLSRNALLVALVVLLVGALVWVGSILLTARVTWPDGQTRGQRLRSRAFAFVACLLILLPSVQAVRYVAIQRSLISAVFDGQRPSNARGPAEGSDPWRDVPRVNVLLLGSDAGTDRIGVRTDSMMVASINTRTGDTVLVGIPRNLENVPFPASDPLHAIWPHGFGPCPDPVTGAEQCLMNAVWQEAAGNHPDLFPGIKNPGLVATRDVIGDILGLKIDYTTVIDLRGFQELVDAMGGVDINATERVCVDCKSDGRGGIIWSSGKPRWIDKGPQHMNGHEALWYARSRAQSDDYSRMRRQRCVAGALVSQVNPVAMLQRYPSLAKVAKKNISIDIPQDDLEAWVELVERIQEGTIRSLPLTDKVVHVTNPDYPKIRAMVRNAVSDHPTVTKPLPTPTTSTTTKGTTTASTAPSTEGLTNLADSC